MSDHEARVRRLADRIQQIVAQLLERRVKDPRLGFVTVTDVRLTNDMREATVFYTVLGDESEQADTAAALKSATGMIRTEVGRITGVRFAPSIAFVISPESDGDVGELQGALGIRTIVTHQNIAFVAVPREITPECITVEFA